MALWTPASLSKRVWWDGDAAVFNGSDQLTSWANAGTSGGSATIAGTPTKATLNGLNGVLFDASGERISHDPGAWGTSGALWIFVVSRFTSTAPSAQGWLHRGTPASSSGMTVVASPGAVEAFANGFGSGSRAKWATSETLNTNASFRSFGLGTTNSHYLNGTSLTLGSSTTTAVPNYAAGTAWIYGEAWSGGSEVLTGEIFQFLVFDYYPTTAERQKLEGWAAWKYGLQANLPGGHPYASAAPTTGDDLTPSLFTNTQTFHAATVAPGAVTLAPSLVNPGQSFFAPTASPGAVTLSPSLVTSGEAFHAPALSAVYGLAPSLLTNTQSFGAATVAPGAVTVSPDLAANVSTFFGPAASPGAVDLAPALLASGTAFFDPIISNGGTALAPPLTTNGQSFFAASVAPGAVIVAPPLVGDTQTFPTAAIAVGAVALQPPAIPSGGAIIAPVVAPGGVSLQPSLLASVAAVYTPALVVGAATVAPGLHANDNSFFAALLEREGVGPPAPAARTAYSPERPRTAETPARAQSAASAARPRSAASVAR